MINENGKMRGYPDFLLQIFCLALFLLFLKQKQQKGTGTNENVKRFFT